MQISARGDGKTIVLVVDGVHTEVTPAEAERVIDALRKAIAQGPADAHLRKVDVMSGAT